MITKVDGYGRIVIPSEMRVALGLHAGDELVLTLQDGELHAVPRAAVRQAALDRLRARIRDAFGDRSLADELIIERR